MDNSDILRFLNINSFSEYGIGELARLFAITYDAMRKRITRMDNKKLLYKFRDSDGRVLVSGHIPDNDLSRLSKYSKASIMSDMLDVNSPMLTMISVKDGGKMEDGSGYWYLLDKFIDFMIETDRI